MASTMQMSTWHMLWWERMSTFCQWNIWMKKKKKKKTEIYLFLLFFFLSLFLTCYLPFIKERKKRRLSNMPTMLSKFIDKAKPRFSFHHHGNHKSGSTSSNESQSHNTKFHLPNNLPTTAITTHIFGYRDDLKDNYVEPPPGKWKLGHWSDMHCTLIRLSTSSTYWYGAHQRKHCCTSCRHTTQIDAWQDSIFGSGQQDWYGENQLL